MEFWEIEKDYYSNLTTLEFLQKKVSVDYKYKNSTFSQKLQLIKLTIQELNNKLQTHPNYIIESTNAANRVIEVIEYTIRCLNQISYNPFEPETLVIKTHRFDYTRGNFSVLSNMLLWSHHYSVDFQPLYYCNYDFTMTINLLLQLKNDLLNSKEPNKIVQRVMIIDLLNSFETLYELHLDSNKSV